MVSIVGPSSTFPGSHGVRSPIRVVIAVSHPIQHFCPLYAELASDPRLDLTVLFGVKTGATDYLDPDFGVVIDTGVRSELSRFKHQFLLESSDLSDEFTITRRQVWDALGDIDPQVVVVYGTHHATPRWTWLWSRRRRRPVVYISDSEDRGDHSRSFSSRLLARTVLGATSALFAVGDANRDFYSRSGVRASKIRDVPFPIDQRLYADAWADRHRIRSATRSELGVEESLVVLTCGKLLGPKRQADLIRAVGNIDGIRPVVAIAGSGEELRNLSQLAESIGVSARFLGFVPPADLPRYYLASDIYAHPSEVDRHPLAISEAISCGLPVLVSDRVGSLGPTDDVRPNSNGDVFPLGDVNALATQISGLQADSALRSRYSAESKRISLERQALAYQGFAEALVELAK